MQPKSPILEYATATGAQGRFPWQMVASVVGVFAAPMFMCICGHLDRVALVVTIPAAAMGWWGAAVRSSVVWRVVAVAVACVATAVLVKNLMDVGWFGHEPIFP